jgi:hypothetical protein
MKRLFAAIMLALLAFAPHLAGAANATFGQHGMALFGGRDGLYAAHLPMFHAPHDYQVLLKIRLADKAQDAALRKRLGAAPVLWTLAPEKFEIDRLAPGAAAPLAGFKADLVLGHFEQDGKTEYAGAAVMVEQVLLYRQLSPHAAVQGSARYLQVGTGTQRFLVKEVDSRPDFDHIAAVAVPPRAPRGKLVVPKTALNETPSAVLQRALPGARVTGTVYYSVADLK